MFNYNVKPIRKKDGSFGKVIIITGNNVDSTKEYKEEIKGFGARWVGIYNSWGWFASNDEAKNKTIIEKMVKPAIMFLSEKEVDKNPMSLEEIIDLVTGMLCSSDSQEEVDAQMNIYMSKDEIIKRLQEFKEDLVNTMNSKDFKLMIEPLIEAWAANGYDFSLLNQLLIKLQDPKSTIVKCASDWAKRPYYRRVNQNAPPLGIFVPVGGKQMFKGREAKEREKQRWLAEHGYASEADLTGGDIEKLRKHLNATYGHTGYEIKYFFYDARYTTVIPGKENEAIKLGKKDNNIAWYNDNGKITTAVGEKIYATLQVVNDSGVDVSSTKNLGGALGVSKGGKIEVLDKAKMNSNYLLTILHEFAHEILHQRYLRDNNPEYAQFYFGRPEGKGFVEQQAELTAWIVCKFYGYPIKESINYAAIWGMTDVKKAVHAFDTVANVATYLINNINKKIKAMKSDEVPMIESRNILNEVQLTGADIARMIGAEDVYNQGLQQIENEEEMRNEAINSFKEMVNKINECDKKRVQDILD